ncbi:hypothetical protein HL658_26365 [Azospirillum sp. RWY-5-1]|uniref:Teneurin-like YD-shell domain-containing protein n=1 Tax=Azospirillum oleiclasticum TaxID=2735135 RepID=A0ABX2TGT1_9PROT|nr:RHS repeat-associated core domain-containing protein [Azospirillum oleiclasticum]NYZ16079.1 hypothetical protein [Azospirillum oleiclasticum]NYZ22960.1 hypothetical protein [Azospirillum oleiclasticum]
MTTNIYSNAFNFASHQDGKVDPRTGMYSAVVHLVTLRPEGCTQAERTISLTFSMTSPNNTGFGIGWTMSLTTFDPQSGVLALGTGERFVSQSLPPVGYFLSFKDKKLKNVEVKRTDGSTLTVYHSDGTVETLRIPGISGPYKCVALAFDNGERFDFLYDPFGTLQRIVNGSTGTECLSLTYNNGIIAKARSVAPGGRKAEVAFTVANGLMVGITVPYDNTNGNASPLGQPSFAYKYLGFANGLSGITQVDNPMGGVDRIAYQEDGHHYHNGQFLPFVTQWERDPGSGQPPVVRRYSYSSGTNFTGYPYNGGFAEDTDNLYRVVGDYAYWSEETLIDRNAGNAILESTTTTYNKFHLMAREEVRRGAATQITTVTYNEIPGKLFPDQPPNLQIAREIRKSWTTTASTTSRSETTIIESDDYGNVVSKTEPSGIRSAYTYYPVAGEAGKCPADPFGLFVRYRKQETVHPAGGKGTARVTGFTHLQCPRLGGGYFVQRWVDTGSNGVVATCAYVNDTSRAVLHGRLQTMASTLNGATTTTNFTYAVSGGALTETRSIVGHDGKRSDGMRRFDLPTAQLLEVRKPGGTSLRLDLDIMARVIAEVASPGTSAEAARRYEYRYASGSGAGFVPAQLRVTDAKGNRFATRYDGMGRSISSADVSNAQSERRIAATAYDLRGRKVTDTLYDVVNGQELALVTRYAYNDWDEVARTTRPDGSVELSDRNYADNSVTTGTLGLNTTITDHNEFDQVSRVTQVDMAGGRLVTLLRGYDGFGRCTSVTDVDGNMSSFEFDVFDRLVRSVTTPADGSAPRTVTATYPTHTSADLSATIAVNGTTLGARSFDGLGRLTTEARAGMAATSYDYSGGGMLPSRKQSPRGFGIDYTYDAALENVTHVSSGQQSLSSFTYDGVSGQVVSAGAPANSRRYSYNTYEYPVTDTLTIGGTESVSRYTHSPGGRLLRFEAPTADVETRSYDSAGRVAGIVNGPCTIATEYDGYGRVVATTATQSGVTLRTTLAYDSYGREASRTFILNGATLQTVNHEYHRNGDLKRRLTRDGAGTALSDESFGYDGFSRLISYRCIGSHYPSDTLGREVAEQSFTFDAFDNITRVVTKFRDGTSNTSTRSYNPAVPGQLVEIADTAPAARHSLRYDEAGNLIDDGHGQTFRYDELDRLSFSSLAGDYGYDAENRLLTQKEGSATPLTLHYGGSRVVGETQGGASIRYRRDGEQVLGRRLQPAGGPAVDELNAVDESGSVVDVASAGKVLGRMYTPYGESGPTGVTPATPLIERNRIAFNGERLDGAANLYHLGNGRRAYSPQLMMFLSPDPLAPFGGSGYSGYGYANGDPINAIDPTGLASGKSIFSMIFSGLGLILSIILFGVAIAAAIPTGGASLSLLAVVGAIGAGLGVVGAVLDVTSASITLADEINGWDRSDVTNALGIASFVFGVAALVTAGATGIKEGVSTFGKLAGSAQKTVSNGLASTVATATLGKASGAQFVTKVTTSYRVGQGLKAGMASFIGLSESKLVNVLALTSFGMGMAGMGMGIQGFVEGAASGGGAGPNAGGAIGTGQKEAPLPSRNGEDNAPIQPYRPVIPRFEDAVASQRGYDREFDRQVGRIRGSYARELYSGRA